MMNLKKKLKVIKVLLNKNSLTISACESASGGNLSALLTSIDGSSSYFKGSIISYSNEIKNKVVGIDSKILKAKGVVSEEVAKLMALKVNKIMNTNICISITGNSSRNNLIENKKSCFYYVGYCIENESCVFAVSLPSYSRRRNQQNVAKWAIKVLYEILNERYGNKKVKNESWHSE